MTAAARPDPTPPASALTAASFIELVEGRRGHFLLESGHHSRLWLDLDALFASPARIAPYVAALADALRPLRPDMICGPLLGGAFLAQLVAQALDTEFSFTERFVPDTGAGLFRAEYRLPSAFRAVVHGRRIAMVDDVMSAGSALRATCAELLSHGGIPIAAGALLVLGSVGKGYFAERDIPVHAVTRDEFEIFTADSCPMCSEHVPLSLIA